nr:glycosyltransferase family A protein [Acetobacter syzygii]
MRNNTPAISVILTTHNCENHAKRVINSILNQTFEDIELIIIDDHSTDATLAICHSLQTTNSSKRIFLHKNEQNSGAAFSRNVGLQKAQGEYVIFLDDDDFYSPLMLELAYKKAITHKADIVVVGSQSYDTQSELTHILDNIKVRPEILRSVFSYRDIKENFFESFTWWAWDKLIRRTMIIDNKLTFQQIRSSNDLSFTCKAFFNAERICIEPQVLVTHIINRHNSLSSSRKLSYACVIYALNNLFQYMNENSIYSSLKNDFCYYCVNFIFWHQSTIQAPEDRLLCIEALNFFKDTMITLDALPDGEIKQKYLAICIKAGEAEIVKLMETMSKDIAQPHSVARTQASSFVSMLQALLIFIRRNNGHSAG